VQAKQQLVSEESDPIATGMLTDSFIFSCLIKLFFFLSPYKACHQRLSKHFVKVGGVSYLHHFHFTKRKLRPQKKSFEQSKTANPSPMQERNQNLLAEIPNYLYFVAMQHFFCVCVKITQPVKRERMARKSRASTYLLPCCWH